MSGQRAKPRGKPFTGADDPRRGKGGRKQNAISLTAISRDFLAMTPKAIGQQCVALASRYNELGSGDGVTMAQYIMASFLLALANDPQPGNMRELWRRVDGEVVSINLDVAALSDEQLERLANGEDVYSVLADSRGGRVGTTQADASENDKGD